jgi:predicted nucleic acid-binding protein
VARLVVDASVVIAVSVDAAGIGPLEAHELIAPPIMQSEALSGLHEMRYRGEISDNLAQQALGRVSHLPVTVMQDIDLWSRAWQVSELMGWAKTYDAEYVALAQLTDCPLLTIDARLARGAARLVRIVTPEEAIAL